jgi:hypothetical protein
LLAVSKPQELALEQPEQPEGQEEPMLEQLV